MANTQGLGRISQSKKHLRPTLRSGRASRTNSNTSHPIPVRVIEADRAVRTAVLLCWTRRDGIRFGDRFQMTFATKSATKRPAEQAAGAAGSPRNRPSWPVAGAAAVAGGYREGAAAFASNTARRFSAAQRSRLCSGDFAVERRRAAGDAIPTDHGG